MRLTFCSADNAKLARQWVEQSETLAGKYLVEEKKARLFLMMIMEKIRLAYRNQGKVREFFALEARYLLVAGFMEEDFRPGELVSHKLGKNLRLSLSPTLASYVLPLTVGAVPLFAERGQGQKRRRERRSATPSLSPKILRS